MGINGTPWAFDPNNPNPRTPDQQLEDYLKTLPPEQRAAYRRNHRMVLAGRRPVEAPAQQPAPRPAPQQPQVPMTPIERLAAVNQARLRQMAGGQQEERQPQAEQPAGQQAEQQAPRAPLDFIQEGILRAGLMRAQQSEDANRLIGKTEDAFRDENEARRDRADLERRMQHSKDMESMRQEGLLQRLQAMNDSAYEPPAPPRVGGPIGVWNPVTMQFDYTDRVQFG